jgi:membrane-bound lytic murein transglycosylase A
VRRPGTAAPPRLVALDAAACRAILRDDSSTDAFRRAAALGVEDLDRVPATRRLRAIDRTVSAGTLREALQIAADAAASEENWTAHLCSRLQLHRVEFASGNAAGRVLVTGYYEPELRASRRRDERFRFPLYRRPDDLVDVELGRFCDACGQARTQGRLHDGLVVPYFTRAEIEAGALAGRGDELAWLDDPVEVFFLHIQGSGKLRFQDGTYMQVSYAGANGRAYTSIGKVLIDRGGLDAEEVSLRTIKGYLRAHPQESADLMAVNERYVFFRTVAVGPIGSRGVPLTAGRSIAADPGVYPPGGLVFLRIGDVGVDGDGDRHERLVVVQDSGVAIRGPGRIDVFWGAGSKAEEIAGDMRAPGEVYLLLPASP